MVPDPQEVYLARRHLGFTADEWAALPWHVARCYRDGLLEELGAGGPADGDPDDPDAALRQIGVNFN